MAVPGPVSCWTMVPCCSSSSCLSIVPSPCWTMVPSSCWTMVPYPSGLVGWLTNVPSVWLTRVPWSPGSIVPFSYWTKSFVNTNKNDFRCLTLFYSAGHAKTIFASPQHIEASVPRQRDKFKAHKSPSLDGLLFPPPPQHVNKPIILKFLLIELLVRGRGAKQKILNADSKVSQNLWSVRVKKVRTSPAREKFIYFNLFIQ